MDHYAVIGHPVDHSLSPRIHAAFARATGEPVAYGRIDPGAAGLAAAVEAFFADGGRGLNVTVPFKAEALSLCTGASPRARRAGVVNTLTAVAGGAQGDNTDGVGLVRDLVERRGVRLAGARVLLLGAGGASRGVLAPLMATAPASVVIANRTPARALDLAAAFSDLGELSGCGFADVPGPGFDVVINASASGLAGECPPLEPAALAPAAVAYDMMYGAGARPFLDWARAAGARHCIDGLGMLVEQAAEAFSIWRGVAPDTGPVRAELGVR